MNLNPFNLINEDKNFDKVEIVKRALRENNYDIPSDRTIAFLIGYIPEKKKWGWKIK